MPYLAYTGVDKYMKLVKLANRKEAAFARGNGYQTSRSPWSGKLYAFVRSEADAKELVRQLKQKYPSRRK